MKIREDKLSQYETIKPGAVACGELRDGKSKRSKVVKIYNEDDIEHLYSRSAWLKRGYVVRMSQEPVKEVFWHNHKGIYFQVFGSWQVVKIPE